MGEQLTNSDVAHLEHLATMYEQTALRTSNEEQSQHFADMGELLRKAARIGAKDPSHD